MSCRDCLVSWQAHRPAQMLTWFSWENVWKDGARGPWPLLSLHIPAWGPASGATVLAWEGVRTYYCTQGHCHQPMWPPVPVGMSPDLTDKCVPFSKPTSTQKRSSRSLAGERWAAEPHEEEPSCPQEARVGEERSLSRIGFRAGDFLLGYLPQNLTSVMDGLFQLSLGHPGYG